MLYLTNNKHSSSLNIDDVFIALGIPNALGGAVKSVPKLIFDMESTEDLENWNMRLPNNKIDLVGKDHKYITKGAVDENHDGKIEKNEMKVEAYHKPLQSHQELVESSCRRIIKGIASGALEKGAVCIQLFILLF